MSAGLVSHWHIRAFRHVRDSLPDNLAKTVACSIVSHLEYCNALFDGLSEANSAKLQRVQSTLAGVIMRQKKI